MAWAARDLAYGGVSPCVPTRRVEIAWNWFEVAGGPIRFQAPSRFQAVARKRRWSASRYRCLSVGEAGFLSPFAGFLPRSGAPAAVRHHRGLRRTRCASSTDSIIGVKSAVTDSATSPSIRCEGGLPAGTSCLLRCVHPELRGQLELFKTI